MSNTMKIWASAISLFFAVVGFTQTAFAQATIVDFNTLPGANLATFTTYTENGFTVSTRSGLVRVATVLGNPVPDLIMSPNASIGINNGGTFTFSSVDLRAATTGNQVVVTGYLNLAQVYTQTFTLTNMFATYSASGPVILDDLVASFSGTPSANVDNIALVAVTSAAPEPSTWIMLILGFGFTGVALRRSRRPRGCHSAALAA